MKKRSIAARLGVAALALTLATSSLTSGTLAKYTSTFQAGGMFTVAKWNVDAKIHGPNGTDWTATATNVTDYFNIVDSKKTGGDAIAPGSAGLFEIDVAGATVAIGQATGTGAITDVDVNYEVYIMPEGNTDNIPAHFMMWDNKGDATNLLDENAVAAGKDETGDAHVDSIDLTNMPQSSDPGYSPYGLRVAKGTIGKTDNVVKKCIIGWRWPFEKYDNYDAGDNNDSDPTVYDQKDTTFGRSNGGNSTKFKITVLMTQVNPNEPTPVPGGGA